MKSERRHEIQENSLARFLEGTFEAAKPHAPLIGIAALALVLGWIAYVILSQDRGVPASEQWNSVYSALDQSFRIGEDDVQRQEVAQRFAAISEQYGDDPAALWAEYFYAQQALTQASDLAFSDPQGARADIERALMSFERVYDDTDQTVLKVKALWGMAEANELQATPEALESAKERYEEIINIWPEGNTAEMAKQRVERLNNPMIVGENGFYAWYRQQDFPSRTAEAARENRPPLEGGLPGLDSLENPGSGLFDATPGMGAAPGSPGGDPLFTPSMNLDEAAESTPQPSTFSEQEGADTTPSDQPGTPADPAVPMTDAPAETPSAEEPATQPAAPQDAPAEEPAAEEPAAEEAPAEEPAAQE